MTSLSILLAYSDNRKNLLRNSRLRQTDRCWLNFFFITMASPIIPSENIVFSSFSSHCLLFKKLYLHWLQLFITLHSLSYLLYNAEHAEKKDLLCRGKLCIKKINSHPRRTPISVYLLSDTENTHNMAKCCHHPSAPFFNRHNLPCISHKNSYFPANFLSFFFFFACQTTA